MRIDYDDILAKQWQAQPEYREQFRARPPLHEVAADHDDNPQIPAGVDVLITDPWGHTIEL